MPINMRPRCVAHSCIAVLILISFAHSQAISDETNPTPTTPAVGLIAHWSFDDCSAHDFAENGHDGEIVGQPECIQGRDGGRALRFLGQTPSPYILVKKDIPLGQAYTISAWIQYSGRKRGWQIVASRMLNATTDQNDAWDLALTGNRLFFFHSGQHHHTEYCCIGGPTWQMITVTVQDIEGLVYVNGKSVHSFEAKPFLATDTVPICIGCNDYNTLPPRHFFAGSIDDLRIYHRALSSEEVRALYPNSPNVAPK